MARLAEGDTAGARRWAERLSASVPLRVLVDAGRPPRRATSLSHRPERFGRVRFKATRPPDPFASAVFHLLRGEWLAASGDPPRRA